MTRLNPSAPLYRTHRHDPTKGGRTPAPRAASSEPGRRPVGERRSVGRTDAATRPEGPRLSATRQPAWRSTRSLTARPSVAALSPGSRPAQMSLARCVRHTPSPACRARPQACRRARRRDRHRTALPGQAQRRRDTTDAPTSSTTDDPRLRRQVSLRQGRHAQTTSVDRVHQQGAQIRQRIAATQQTAAGSGHRAPQSSPYGGCRWPSPAHDASRPTTSVGCGA